MTLAGTTPDPWQKGVLESTAPRVQLLCSRQVGKTEVAAALAIRTAELEAPATVLVLSPSERQSAEFLRRVRSFHAALGGRPKTAGRSPVASWYETMVAAAGKDEPYYAMPAAVRESALQMHLANGSRVIGLPATEGTVRGYSDVNLLVIDEASRVPDDLYRAIRPMLSVSRGRLLALSTPFGKRGWFYEEWVSGRPWDRYRITADQCPRITAEFLAEERAALGERWFRQEYYASFEDTIDAVFLQSDIEAAFVGGAGLGPLW